MMHRVVLVTGLSGAGKASVLRTLEDLGYEAVDNPPLTLVETLVSRSDTPLAIGLDARSRGFDVQSVRTLLARLKANPLRPTELIYAWADESVLLRRYTETRRRHPLAPEGRVVDGIAREAALTRLLREDADMVVDTSDMPLPDLRRRIEQRFRPSAAEGGVQRGLTLSLVSFAFPAGLPREADMVFDARFLRNPHYDPILRPRTGRDAEVAAYIAADPDYEGFFHTMAAMMALVLPRFVQEGKKYATVAIGCTGGRHRSVHLVERMAADLGAMRDQAIGTTWQVAVLHRELAPDGVGQVPAATDVSGKA